MKSKVYTFSSEFNLVTGIQRVIMDIHEAIKNEYDSKLVGQFSFEELNLNLGIIKEDYIHKKNWFMFKNSIVILHQRKFLPIFWILNHIFFQHITLIYVHHSMLYGHRFLTMMPKHVVCISDKGRENLVNDFKVPEENITKIHNCVKDIPMMFKDQESCISHNKIKILYPASISTIKRQCELVEHLKGRLNTDVEIYFAGIGSQLQRLKDLTARDSHFTVLGFVSDIPKLMRECDYVMLFSEKEGLPITLIEATMVGRPIICNDVGGNTEIAINGKNGFVIDSWEELITTINNLPLITDSKYYEMSLYSREIYNQYYTFEIFKENYLNYLKRL